MANFVDVENAVGFCEDYSQVVAARLAGEAFYFEGCLVAGDFDAVFGDSVFNIANFHFIGVILDHDSSGLGAGRAVVDTSHGAKSDFGTLCGALFFKAGDSKPYHKTTAIGGTCSGLAYTGRAVFSGGPFLGVCK